MKLCVITTMYRSTYYLEEFYRRITMSAQDITDDYEFIFTTMTVIPYLQIFLHSSTRTN
jgi:hypothetical protein